MSASSPPPIPPIPPLQNQLPVETAATPSVPAQDDLVANKPARKKHKLLTTFFMSLFFGLMSLFIFWLSREGFKESFVWLFSGFTWIILGLGIVFLIAGFGMGVYFFVTNWQRKIKAIFGGLAIFGTLGLSIHFLIKVLIAICVSTGQVTILAGLMSLRTPQGIAVASIINMIDSGIKNYMANATGPEWRMIKIEYLGSDLPETPGKASFSLINTGPHKISALKGNFHAWTLFHAEKVVTFESSTPLEPGESIRIDFPLDNFGGQVKDIIDGKNNNAFAAAGNAYCYLESKRTDQPRTPVRDQPAVVINPKPDIDYHLRFQLQKMETSDGRRYVAWLGNMEIADKNAFFEMMRDFTSPEWKMIQVKHINDKNSEQPYRASFRLTNTGKLTIASMKGKFHVMDITDGHVEKTVTLTPEKPLTPGDSMVFHLSAGSESELAEHIIARESEYDNRVGNKEQTSYLMRFQLQELHTSDGRKIWIWFGELKGNIKAEEK